MDLTTSYPRSVHDKLFGVVQLARTIDKAQAQAQGTVGEYHYNCSMDQAIFAFLGIDHEQLLNVAKNASNIAEIEAYAKPFVEKKTAEEIDAWNRQYVSSKPEGDSLKYFLELRHQVAPDRTDVTTWPDLLDLDEKRAVPNRATTSV